MHPLRSARAGAATVYAAGLVALAGACQGSDVGPNERVDAAAFAAPARRLALALPFGYALLARDVVVAPAPPASEAVTQAPALTPPLEAMRVKVAARGPCLDAGMAHLGAFCIDRYEAHLALLGPDGVERLWPHQLRPESNHRYKSRSEAGVYPQGYISRGEASAACANAGKRLCTLVEWRRACRGARGTTYPYGVSLRPGACNSGKPHLLTKWHGDDANAWTFENFNSPSLNLEPGFLARGGEYEACRSEDDVYDLVGNLHEWVSDPVPLALVTRTPDESGVSPLQAVRPGNGMFVGGFFSTTNQNGEGCGYVTLTHEPTYHDYSTGFRCCADADAASASG